MRRGRQPRRNLPYRSDIFVDEFLHRLFGRKPDVFARRGATLEDHDAGNAHDRIIAREIGGAHYVDPYKYRPALVVVGKLFHYGRKHAARAAPIRIKIDYERFALLYCGAKIGAFKRFDHFVFPPLYPLF